MTKDPSDDSDRTRSVSAVVAFLISTDNAEKARNRKLNIRKKISFSQIPQVVVSSRRFLTFRYDPCSALVYLILVPVLLFALS